MTTLYLLLVTNRTFWRKAFEYLSGSPVVFTAFAIGISALVLAALVALSAKYLIKPALIFFILVASTTSWFNDQFGVIIDRDMIRNAAVTTNAEAGHLITIAFILHIVLTGILPSLFIVWVRVIHRPILQKVAYNLGVIIPCLAVFLLAALSEYKTFAGVGRQHGDIIMTLNPFMPVVSTVRYAVDAERSRNIVAQPLGTDAHRNAVGNIGKPRVTIIVAGETARAADFSLGGYGRDTNPELAKRNVVYFPDTTSCGTSTAVSIPCMFSVYTRAQYSHRKGLETQNLLDVLTHAKVDVSWLDNDTGSYNVTDRVSYLYLPTAADPRFCENGECLDGVLLDKVDNWLSQVKGDSLLVLHELGSHGPAYYQRYPDSFRHFQPDCRAGDFDSCKPEEIVNAYDNTVLYTDHVIASVIDKLKARSDRLAGAVVYVSDHGESLGENGIYLHGAPYIIAPPVQIHVPFLVWVADDLQKSAGFDMACVARHADTPHSHDNLFHTVLGLMDISTTVYDPTLDVFSGCRRSPNSVADASLAH